MTDHAIQLSGLGEKCDSDYKCKYPYVCNLSKCEENQSIYVYINDKWVLRSDYEWVPQND